MSGDVYISFGADVGELEAAMAKANAEVRGLARELSALAGEAVKTGASADSELGQKLNATAAALAGAKGHVRELKDEMRSTASAASESGDALEGHFSQIREILQGLTSPLRAVRENLGEVAEAFLAAFAVERVAEFVKQMGELGENTERTAKILGLSSEEVGRLEYKLKMTGTSAERLDMMMGRFQRGLAEAASKGTGQVAEGLRALGLSANELIGMRLPEQLEAISAAVSRFEDSPTKTAALQALGRGFAEWIPLLDQGVEGMRKLDQKADATNTTLKGVATDALANMQHGLIDLGDAIRGNAVLAFEPFIDVVNAAVGIMRDLASETAESVKQGGEWARDLQGLVDILKDVLTGIVLIIEALKQLGGAAGGIINAVNDYLSGLAKTVHVSFVTLFTDPKAFFDEVAKASAEANAKVKADLEDAFGGWEKAARDAKTELDSIWGWNKGAGAGAEGAVGAPKKPLVPAMDTSDAATLQARIDALTQSIERAKAAAGGLGSAIKGAAAVPLSADDRDKVIRTIYGEGANQGPVGQEAIADVIRNRTQAGTYGATAGDVVSAPKQFSVWNPGDPAGNLARGLSPDSAAYSQIGSIVDKVFAGAVPDITRGASHYYNPSVASPAWGPQLAQQNDVTIGAHRFVGQSGGAGSSSIPQMEGELAKLKEKQLELNQAAEGGSATRKADLAIAQAEAQQQQNALTVAKQKAAAAQADADANRTATGGASTDRQAKLDEAAANAKKKVLEVTNQQAEAEARLDIAKAKQAGDSKAVYDAEMKLAQIKTSAAGQDPAKQAEAMQSQIAAQAAYENAVRERVNVTARAEIDAAKETATATREQLNEKLKTRQISEAQWLSGTKAALDQEKAAVQAAYDQELAAAQQNSTKKIEIKTAEQKQLAEIAQQEAQASSKAAEQTESSYESTIGGILSSFTSAFKGMISGHETFRQAMLKALENLADKFIDMVEKMVVKWIAGQLAQTAATTTGVTARTAAETAGNAAGIGSLITNALKAISAGAGQTAAGVSGFMAPITGPAAPAIGAAAGATVLAEAGSLVSADIGMWQVPHDMVAQIHRNELVMPAAEAGALRSMLSSGASGNAASGKSVHINPSVNLNVQSMDSQSFRGFLKDNQRHLAAAMHNAARSGATLGMRAGA